jgi:hypothetical protein
MIFAAGVKEPTMFIMLCEQDVAEMRQGRTTFVDERATSGAKFNKVIVSLHKTNQEAISLLKNHGFVEGEASTAMQDKVLAGEERCPCCNGVVAKGALFEGRCILCWADRAKKLERAGG